MEKKNNNPIGCWWFLVTCATLAATIVLMALKLSGAVELRWVTVFIPAMVGPLFPALLVGIALLMALAVGDEDD